MKVIPSLQQMKSCIARDFLGFWGTVMGRVMRL
jgi:hypothetical protein